MNLTRIWDLYRNNLYFSVPGTFLAAAFIGGVIAQDIATIIFVITGLLFLLIGPSVRKRSEKHGVFHYIVTCIFIVVTLLLSIQNEKIDQEFWGLFFWVPSCIILILSSLLALYYRIRDSRKVESTVFPKSEATEGYMFGSRTLKVIALIILLNVAALFLLLKFQPPKFEIAVMAVYLGSIFLILISIILAAFRTIIRYLGKLAKYAGSTIAVRLISLSVVALMFPYQVASTFRAPLYAVIMILQALIKQLNNALQFVGRETIYSKFDAMQIVMIIQPGIVTLLFDIWDAIYQMFTDLQISKLILAISLWIILGQLITILMEGKSEEGTGVNRFFTAIKNTRLATRQNLLLVLVFMISGFLIIAAMVAIPWVQVGNQTTEAVRKQRIDALGNINGTKEAFIKEITDISSENPLKVVFEQNSNRKYKEKKAIKYYKDVMGRFENRKNEVEQERKKSVLNKWDRFKEAAWKRVKDQESKAIGEYLSNKINLGDKDEEDYFQSILDWIRLNNQKTRLALVVTLSDINLVDNEIRNSHQNYLNEELTICDSLEKNLSDPVGDLRYAYPQMPSFVSYKSFVSFDFSDAESTPSPPAPGSQWGIFGLVAGWLLKTRSLPLILITGMLGFGLFGSVVSSFVRGQEQRTEDQPYVQDLPAAVVRGLSAAVVVFLAVEGGLAIFTTTQLHPNPYVLFFTCLVGAVFSENVWNWARKRLSERFEAQPAENAAEALKQEDKK